MEVILPGANRKISALFGSRRAWPFKKRDILKLLMSSKIIKIKMRQKKCLNMPQGSLKRGTLPWKRLKVEERLMKSRKL